MALVSSELDRVRAELTETKAELAETESAFLRIAEFVESVTNLLEGHAQIVGNVRAVTNLHKQHAAEIERKRFDALASDLSGEPPPEP